MTGRQSECYGKKVYNSYYAAQRAARAMNRHLEGTKGNPYRCKTCRLYHVGNTLGKMKHRRANRHNLKEGYRGRV